MSKSSYCTECHKKTWDRKMRNRWRTYIGCTYCGNQKRYYYKNQKNY